MKKVFALFAISLLVPAASLQAQESNALKSLEWNTPVDPELQERLEIIDRELGKKLGIPDSDRGCGIYDLKTGRLALVNGDKMFYGASVPKIAILLAYFEKFPKAAESMDWETERELQLMIKRSSNEMAAKYAKIVGLEAIRETLESPQYKLYDREHGGGIWTGKYYGEDEPRMGDPIANLSHAVTMRQCLRFYEMLSQGRFGQATNAMRRSFLGGWDWSADYHLEDFIAGIKGRTRTVYRKNGLYEDWHLDTAFVSNGVAPGYLIAGVARSRRGHEYLTGLAEKVDPLFSSDKSSLQIDHHLIRAEAVVDLTEENHWRFESAQLHPPTGCPFNEALLSWNVRCPSESGFLVEMRIGQSWEDNVWSPYLYLGSWGQVPSEKRRTEFEKGKIDIDYFVGSERFDRIQYRVTGYPTGASRSQSLRIESFHLVLSDTTDMPTGRDHTHCTAGGISLKPFVPVRSQKLENPKIASRICSPTSVAMVLEYFGKSIPTERVAEILYDKEHDIYGNWTRAIQGAFELGLPGRLDRCCSIFDAFDYLDRGNPIVISIQAEEGQLIGAPYNKTTGHLLVLTGMDEDGNFLANDPAAPTLAEVRRVYKAEEIEKVWIRNAKGTAYVFSDGMPNPMALAQCAWIPQDIRYATDSNIFRRKFYGAARAYLRVSVATRLMEVAMRLPEDGSVRLKILDAYRPLSVQKRMWELFPDERFVANPAKGSRHNRGAAVDVTLIDKDGKELEMPSAFDHFGPESHRDYQGCSEEAKKNRKILQDAMEAAGFVGLPTEWWHFDDPDWEKYPILDIPLEELP